MDNERTAVLVGEQLDGSPRSNGLALAADVARNTTFAMRLLNVSMGFGNEDGTKMYHAIAPTPSRGELTSAAELNAMVASVASQRAYEPAQERPDGSIQFGYFREVDVAGTEDPSSPRRDARSVRNVTTLATVYPSWNYLRAMQMYFGSEQHRESHPELFSLVNGMSAEQFAAFKADPDAFVEKILATLGSKK